MWKTSVSKVLVTIVYVKSGWTDLLKASTLLGELTELLGPAALPDIRQLFKCGVFVFFKFVEFAEHYGVLTDGPVAVSA